MSTLLWVFLILLVGLVTYLWQLHVRLIRNLDYNQIVRDKVFQNGGKGYLNVGLWNTGACGLATAQENMYRMIFSLAELDTHQVVLEIGGGTAEHYLLWQAMGLQSRMTCWEPHTLPHAAVRSRPNLVQLQKHAAHDLCAAATYDKIICVESAFHYPDRPTFFQRCFTALKPGGVLILTDIVLPTHSELPQTQLERWYARRLGAYYGTHILKIHKTNQIDKDTYYAQLYACRFRSIYVVDLSEQTFYTFYGSIQMHVRRQNTFTNFPKWTEDAHHRLCGTMCRVKPFRYILAICVK